MNEDELRAFLESATVGDDPTETPNERDEAPETQVIDEVVPAAAAPATPVSVESDRRPSFEELMGIAPGQTPAAPAPAAPAAAAQPAQVRPAAPVAAPAAAPMTPQPAAAAGVAAGGAAGTAGGDPDLVPLVLPGPTQRPLPPQPARAPQPAAPQPTPQQAAPQPVAAPRAAATPPPVAAPVAARGAAAPAAVPTTPVPAAQTPQAEPAPATAPLPLGIDELLGQQPQPAASTSAGDDGYDRIAVTGGEKKRFVPWIVAGAGAIIVLIVAVLIVFAVRGGETPTPDPTTAPTTSEAPSETTPSDDPEPSETTPTPTPTTTSDKPPTVDVGSTNVMAVQGWGIEVDVSNRLGIMNYTLESSPPAGRLIFSGGLLEQLPASCAKEPWGMTNLGDGKFEALKPTTRCAAAPELYDELWGLMAAMAASARAV